MKMSTLGVHAGRWDFKERGIHASPIDLSSTYPVTNLEEGRQSLDDFANGAWQSANPIYSRLHNETVFLFEKAMAEMEKTNESVAFSSGMAAITAVILASKMRGRHILAIKPLYGTTDHLLSTQLLDVDVTFCEAHEIHDNITEQTSLIYLETPSNPTLTVVDIAHVVAQAGDIPVAVDSTFATPILQQPALLGATYVIHSATKFLGGHGDVLAGVVATDSVHGKLLRQVRLMTGANLHPLSAYLLHRGLQTLKLRVEKAQENAVEVVEFLENHPMVHSVFYPGRDSSSKEIVGRQMRGTGSVLAFEVHGGFESAAEIMKSVKLVTPAVSLGSVDTLIQHPAGLTHRVVDEETKRKYGISEGLIRLSLGVEDAEDIIADLERSLLVAQKRLSMSMKQDLV